MLHFDIDAGKDGIHTSVRLTTTGSGHSHARVSDSTLETDVCIASLSWLVDAGREMYIRLVDTCKYLEHYLEQSNK